MARERFILGVRKITSEKLLGLPGAGRSASNILITSCNMPRCVVTSRLTCSNSASCDSHSNQWQFVLHLDTLIRRFSHIMIASMTPNPRLATLDPRKLP